MIGRPAVENALAALDTNACVRLAQDLIRVPSVTGDERAVQDLAALTLEEAGLKVDSELPAFNALWAAHLEEFGVAPELEGAPYGWDVRLLVHEAGTPAVLYGPGDIRQAHSTDEWIAVDEIVQAARVVTAAAARYLAA